MKELSIEEKAKRFDEAIKRAKELLEIGLKDTRDKRVVLSFFPELKESNDERIRKELLDFCKSRAEKFPNDSKYKNISAWIVWLEKQGEQKKTLIEEEFPYDNPSDTLEGEIENIWGKLSSGGRFSATKEGFREVITHFVNYFKEQDDRELVEQKIAGWSKENNRWLKSIKDRLQPRPKQEWSKEDENLLKLSLENLTELKDRFGEGYGKVGDCISWLKLLKDRYTWKPSKEQMETLRHACGGNYVNLRILESLYNDLKKLKQL